MHEPECHPRPILDQPKYLEQVQRALGIGALLPETVQQAVNTSSAPEDITWEGAPVWRTAYFTALRAEALARRGGDPEEEHARCLSRTARNALLANEVLTPKELPSHTWADTVGPRATLQRYFADVLRCFTASPPRESERLPSGKPPIMSDALLLVGPTAVGKTMVAGNYLAQAGLGKIRPDGGRRRGLWITITQKLIEDCLDESKTLRRCLGNEVSMTAIWEDNKETDNAQGDLVCVTKQSLKEALAKGLIKPEDFDVLVFDEAHEVLSQQITELLMQFDCPKILMTATPSRSQQRNLLDKYHYVRPMERREAIERGLLSPVRILEYAADSDAHAEHLAALAAVEIFIKKGKKATIYCQAGHNNAQARRVAALVNIYAEQLMGDEFDASLSYAEMVGSARSDSLESVRAFERQTHGGVRTTCQMLGVGWDYPDLDGCIFVGKQIDFLALEQESGRPLRPKADGREAIWAEITTPFEEGDTSIRYSLAQTVGLDYIPGSDFVLGPTESDKAKAGAKSGSPRPGAQTAGRGGYPPDPPEGHPRTGARSSKFEQDHHPDLRAAIVLPGTSIVEIIISPDKRDAYIPPPEFATTDTSLARSHKVPLQFIHYYLEGRSGLKKVPFKLIRRVPLVVSEDIDEGRTYQRYYHTEELQNYLSQHPIPPVSAGRIYAKSSIAHMLHIPESMVDDAIYNLQLPEREPTRAPMDAGRGSKVGERYSIEELARITEWVERVPMAESDDVPYVRAVEHYPFAANFLSPEDRIVRRHRPGTDRKGAEYFVSAETMRQLEVEQVRRQNLVPLKKIADRTGVTIAVLERALTNEERAIARTNRFTPPGGTRHAPHLPSDIAEAVEARIKEQVRPKPLPLWQITLRALSTQCHMPENTLRTALKDYAVDSGILPGGKAPSKRYPLALALRKLMERGAPLREVVDSINLDMLPASADATKEQLEYGHKVLTEVFGVSINQLEPVSDPASTWLRLPQAQERINCTFQALRYLIAQDRNHQLHMRRSDSDHIELRESFINDLCAYSTRITPVREDWVTHERLAEKIGKNVDQLVGFMTKNGITVDEGYTKLVRVQHGRYDYDIAYAPRIWRRVTLAASSTALRG